MTQVEIFMHDFLLPNGLLDGEPPYWYSLIPGDDPVPRSYDGKPRSAAVGETPRVIVLEPGGNRDAFLSSYGASLGYISDAWFATREAAIQSAIDDVGEASYTWHPIPADHPDPEIFALRAAAVAFNPVQEN